MRKANFMWISQLLNHLYLDKVLRVWVIYILLYNKLFVRQYCLKIILIDGLDHYSISLWHAMIALNILPVMLPEKSFYALERIFP